MNERHTRTYSVNGRVCSFDFDSFREMFGRYCLKNGLKKEEAEVRIGGEVGVSCHAVHSWRNRINAPVDIGIVKKLAALLELPDEAVLLIKKEERKTEELNERQLAAAKRIFDCIVDMMFYFKNESRDVFKEIRENATKHYSKTITDETELIYAVERLLDETDEYPLLVGEADRDMEKVKIVLAREYFDLHDTEIYAQFSSFCENELRDLDEEYLTCTDSLIYFCGAMKKLHSIIGAEADPSFYAAMEPPAPDTPAESEHNDGEDTDAADLPF